MPSEPTLFDDEGDDLGGDRSGSPMDDRTSRSSDDRPGERADGVEAGAAENGRRRRNRRTGTSSTTRHPNYLFRRAVVVGGVVAVFAAGALVVTNLIGSGADSTTDGSASADWNRVVTLDDRTGTLVILDDEGEQLGRRDVGIRDATDLAVVDSTAVSGADGEATVVDLGADDDDPAPEPVAVGASGITRPSGSALTMITPATAAGRGLIVHGPSGERLDTDTFAPVAGARYELGAARSDPSGRHLLVTDSGNFQSVLFSFDREEPSYFPGLALAVDGDAVVTAQNVGNDATVSVFDHTEESLGSARTPSVRAALLTDDSVRLVTVEGRILDLDIDSGDTEEGEELGIGTVTQGHVGTAGDRLVVVGSDGTAVVADDGSVVGTYPGLLPRETAASTAPLGTRCLALGVVSGDDVVVVDTTNGDVIAEARSAGTVHPSADGCTVVADAADGVDVLTADGVRRIEVAGTIVALSPDATRIVVERDGRHLLTPLDTTGDVNTDDGTTDSAGATDATDDEDPSEPAGVDIGPSGRLVAFTDL